MRPAQLLCQSLCRQPILSVGPTWTNWDHLVPSPLQQEMQMQMQMTTWEIVVRLLLLLHLHSAFSVTISVTMDILVQYVEAT